MTAGRVHIQSAVGVLPRNPPIDPRAGLPLVANTNGGWFSESRIATPRHAPDCMDERTR